MSWHVELDQRVERELERLPGEVLQRVTRRLLSLEEDPFRGAKKLQGSRSAYRVRVGDYRIVFEVLAEDRKVVVYKVRHRRDVYR